MSNTSEISSAVCVTRWDCMVRKYSAHGRICATYLFGNSIFFINSFHHKECSRHITVPHEHTHTLHWIQCRLISISFVILFPTRFILFALIMGDMQRLLSV